MKQRGALHEATLAGFVSVVKAILGFDGDVNIKVSRLKQVYVASNRYDRQPSVPGRDLRVTTTLRCTQVGFLTG